MTAKATAAVLLIALGSATAFAVGSSPADPPMGSPPTVFRTVTEHAVDKYQGKTAWWWAHRAVDNRRHLNAQRLALRRIRRHIRAAWAPTVSYAIHLASSVFGVSESKMRAVAFCESTFNPYAVNGRYRGIFQLGWSPYGLSPYDPVASALSTAATVVHDGGWRQWSCG